MASTIIGGSSASSLSSSEISMPINIYTTLPKLRTFLSLGSADTSDDNSLKTFLRSSSRAIDRYCRREFYPRRHTGANTLKYDLPPKRNILRLEEDVLEIKGLSDVNGASEIDSNIYWLKAGDRWNITPYDRVEMDVSSGSLFNFSGTPQRAVHVDAVTGYHEDYNNAWLDSGASLTGSMTNATTTALVSGSAGATEIGVAPRFEVGQTWKIDNEFMMSVEGQTTSQVRVLRGINGTTAASHALDSIIYLWDTEQDIEFSAKELAAFMYQKAMAPMTNRVSFQALGAIELPNTWPEQTIDRLQRFRKHDISAI